MNLKSGYSYLLPFTQKEIQVFKNYQTKGANKIILHSLFPVNEYQTWIECCWDTLVSHSPQFYMSMDTHNI